MSTIATTEYGECLHIHVCALHHSLSHDNPAHTVESSIKTAKPHLEYEPARKAYPYTSVAMKSDA